jgi:radical SAM superfamily enzyme YgiQ (UPF0313 family)
MPKLLILYPNTANYAAISPAVAILGGIARQLQWEISYFDTYNYENPADSLQAKEVTGEFKPGITTLNITQIPFERLAIDLQKRIDDFKPDVLAITCISYEYQYLMSFFPEIRIPENTITIIGGVHPILRAAEVIQTGLFDLVSTGEGEGTFYEFLKRIETGGTLLDLQGTWHHERKTGKITNNPKRTLLDSDDLWRIDSEYGFLADSYFKYPFDGKIVRRFELEVARGCPYDCTYCGNSALRQQYRKLGKYVRRRPLDSTFKQFRNIISEHGIEMFYLSDECFLTHPVSWLKDFGRRYADEVRKPFIIQTRPETVTEEKIDILQSFKAPFFQVSVGVESGSERILSEICNRKTKVGDVIKAFDLLNRRRIRNCAFFMIGFPSETRTEIFQSIKLCRRINPTVALVSIFQPLPGQQLTELCIERGYITGKEPLVSFTGSSILKMPQISPREISNLRRTFLLYAKLPELYYPEIEKCEHDYENNLTLYHELVDLRWKGD